MVLAVTNSLTDPLQHLTIRLHLPYPVAPHYNKVYVFVYNFGDVGVGGDHLLLWFHVGRLLVLEVAQGPRQVEASVYPSEGDVSSGFGNPI